METFWFVLVLVFQVGMLALLGWIVYDEWRSRREASDQPPAQDKSQPNPPTQSGDANAEADR